MMSTTDRLRLSLAAEPQNIARARHAVAALAEELGMGEPALGDVKTVVSEACSNVVRHAYPEQPGLFELEAFLAGEEISIVVRDFGAGVRPRPAPDPGGLRLGIGLISSLSSHYEITGLRERGTEVRISMPTA
jgi:serine/threonine-protein kinase RsbW